MAGESVHRGGRPTPNHCCISGACALEIGDEALMFGFICGHSPSTHPAVHPTACTLNKPCSQRQRLRWHPGNACGFLVWFFCQADNWAGRRSELWRIRSAYSPLGSDPDFAGQLLPGQLPGEICGVGVVNHP